MTILDEHYQLLAPRVDSLSDIVVLAQAWKKSHAFIRRHNWYADILELDASTIDLEDHLVRWGSEVREEGFRPKDLLLVPAPKNAKWSFREEGRFADSAPEFSLDELRATPTFDDWGPSEPPPGPNNVVDIRSAATTKLRPLAHLAIRDQTLATAVMMCLADAVESAQGNTSDRVTLAARSAGVVSYGNRLHCTWESSSVRPDRARFSWGNGRSYRQYFQDYRAFLARPRHICADLMHRLAPGRELFVVSLDIKSFFDSVDRVRYLPNSN